MNAFFANRGGMSKEVEIVSGKIKMLSSEETKKQIVLESYESELSLNKFAKQKGISPASLCQWRKKYPNPAGEGQTSDDDLRSQNESLKKEVFRLKAYLGHKLFELDAPKL